MSAVETSIIIRTRNEGKHLGRLLEGILAQEYDNREIIIVDSGSADDTLAVAARYPVKIVTIKKEDFSFGYSLNVGCRNASGEYLVFVSAHTYPTSNRWLGNLIGPFEDQKIGMVYGRQIGNETTKISEEKDMLNNFGDKSRILVEESLGNNANAAIRKSLWLQTPFNETLPGIEDIDWARKIQTAGYYVYYKADAVICHIHDETYRQIYHRFRREAIAYRMIYPDGSPHAIEDSLVSGLIVNTLRDIKFGFSSKRPWRKILAAIPYRVAEYWGCRDGFSHKGSMSRT
jgi:glycosyltransferase involved in cell wall biosynthesis